jgi:hypothetical protein
MKKIFIFSAIILFFLCVALTADKKVTGNINVAGDIKYQFAHAAAYAEAITYTPLVTQNIYTKLRPTFTTSEAANITSAGDSITIVAAGHYLVQFSVTMSGANGDDFRVKMYKNNAITGINGSNHITTTGATNFANLSYFWYVIGLVAGDRLSFKITNTSSNGDPTISDIKFYIRQEPD